MKKVAIILILVVTLITIIFLFTLEKEKDYLRIHIRANSNSELDQLIKYEIKDIVVEFLQDELAVCSSKNQAKSKIEENSLDLEKLINNHLKNNGFNYKCTMQIKEEYFPDRAYGDLFLKAGVYEALIIELGNASGDNWWCVAFPPLCFKAKPNSQIKPKWLVKDIFYWIKAKLQ